MGKGSHREPGESYFPKEQGQSFITVSGIWQGKGLGIHHGVTSSVWAEKCDLGDTLGLRNRNLFLQGMET